MKSITIYTDGACKKNPGNGGWAAIIRWGYDNDEELHGNEANTTNNRMEMMALIKALETLGNTPYEIDICSDSKYVINGLEKGWAKSWKKNNWHKYTGEEAKNKDLWERLLELTALHKIHYHWIKGHAENKYNNRCDELAVMESKLI